MIKLMQHPEGPTIPAASKRWFKTWVELANYAEDELSHGAYYATTNGNSLAAMHEVKHEEGSFYVENYGNV